MRIKRSVLFITTIILVVVLSFCIFSQLAIAVANEPTEFKNVTLSVYPEYDDLMEIGPNLLVMLQGKIVGTDLPAQVRFFVPATAIMYSAGWQNAQGVYSRGVYSDGSPLPDRKASQISGWDEISFGLPETFNAQTDTFRVEYYDPLNPEKTEKQLSYEFLRFYPIKDLSVIVLEPKKSADFSVSPKGSQTVNGEGYNVYLYSYTDLAVDTALRFDITYTSKSSSKWIVIIVAIIVILVIVGIFLWIRKLKKRNEIAVKKSSVKRKHGKSGNWYCSKCGRSLDSSFQFCPYCGVDKARKTRK
jgi:hypothetical protein